MDRPVLDHDGPWTEDAYLDLRRSGAGPGCCGRRVELVDGALVVGPGRGPVRDGVVDRLRETVAAALPDGLRVLGPVPLRLGPDCVLVPDLVVTRVRPVPALAPDAPVPGAAVPDAPVPGAAVPGAAVPETAVSEAAVPGEVAAGEVAPDAAGPDGEAGPAPDAGSGPVAVPDPPAGPADVLPADAGPADVLDAADVLMVVEVVGAGHGVVDRSFKPQLYARSRIPYSLLVDCDAPFAVAAMIIRGRYHEYASAAAGGVLRMEEPFVLHLDLSPDTALDTAPGA